MRSMMSDGVHIPPCPVALPGMPCVTRREGAERLDSEVDAGPFIGLHARSYEGEARPAVVIVSDDCLCRHCAAFAVVAFEQPPVVALPACGSD